MSQQWSLAPRIWEQLITFRSLSPKMSVSLSGSKVLSNLLEGNLVVWVPDSSCGVKTEQENEEEWMALLPNWITLSVFPVSKSISV